MNLKIRKKSAVLNEKAATVMLKRQNQSSTKLRPSVATLHASRYETPAESSALATNMLPVTSTMTRSVSLATAHGRLSSVSKTSLRATRRPPNSRVENHRNSGTPTRVSFPRRATTSAKACSTCANASTPCTRACGGRNCSSSWCSSICWLAIWCWTR